MIGLEITPGHRHGTVTSSPLAAFFEAGDGQSVALAAGVGSNLSVWTEIGANHAAWMRLDGVDAATRWSWRETLVAELRNIYTVGEMVLSPGWSQLQSSGSGLQGSYTGNRAISTSSGTATASVTVDRSAPYDVWIHYTGRTAGGYCRVDIDGTQALVTEIADPAGLGFKAFSTYSETDLDRRRSVMVASGLTGVHDITISSGGTATPGGGSLMIEAVAITGGLADPRILPPMWQPGVAYEMGDEVQFGGTFYAARTAGISGATGPTHTAGTGSDGAIDWRADDRPTYPQFVAVDYASEREYAARVVVDAVAAEIGGQTHGNENLQSRTVVLDGATWVPQTTGTGLSVGTQIDIVEVVQWQTDAGVPVADCQLNRKITPGAALHTVDVSGIAANADFDWLYAGMLPMVAWDGERQVVVAQTVAVGDAAPVVLVDYEGIDPPNLDFADAQRIGVTAALDDLVFTYGQEAGAVAVPGNVVNQFDTFLRPNLNATVSGGSSDWQAKAYVTGGAPGGLTLGVGDTLAFFNRHVLRVENPIL